MMDKIISNLYCSTSDYPYFKDFYGVREMSDKFHILRGVWEITDLDLWFESDLEEGAIYIPKRIRDESKYDFKKKR